MDNEEASMTAFGLLGGALLLGSFAVRGERKTLLGGASLASFGVTTVIGGFRIIKVPEYKRNFQRNITKGTGVGFLGAGITFSGMSLITMAYGNPAPEITNAFYYGGMVMGVAGLTALSVANDMGNIVGWEAGDEKLAWWVV